MHRAGGGVVDDGETDIHDEHLIPARQRLARTASRMTSATALGCDIMITCEPSTSVSLALARWAMERTTSAPAAVSLAATTAQLETVFQAGAPDGSVNAASATGRWVTAMMSVNWRGRSAANASWNAAGSMANSVAVPPPLVG